jgi:transposase
MLDHLGLVAGCYDELGVSGIVDSKLVKKREHKLSHGVVLKAMILNGLGFVDRRLYLCSEFYGKVSCERLLGEDVSPLDLNDDVLGRTLDRVYEHGSTRLFNDVVFNVMKGVDVPRLLHVDTTSFSVHGEYGGEGDVKIDFGLPKDGRWDLKRYVLGLVCNQQGIPLFMKSFSGNYSDKKSLLEMIVGLQQGLQNDRKVYYVADSAFYTEENLVTLGGSTFWISRVPSTINEAKELLDKDLDLVVSTDPRYSFFETVSDYAGIWQKWVVVRSVEMREKMLSTFDKNLEKEMDESRKSLKRLVGYDFFCEEDALKAAWKWIAEHPLLEFQELGVETVRKTRGRGRPSKNQAVNQFYRVKAKTGVNQKAVDRRKERLGRFIIATNDVDKDAISLLDDYKGQGRVEKGFRFLKDDTFGASDVYLKSQKRVEALAMVMVLCLLIYSVLEWKLRRRLQEEKKTVRNQVKKQVQNPTMKWIFYMFLSIAVIQFMTGSKTHTAITNMTEELEQIVELLGPDYEKYYS